MATRRNKSSENKERQTINYDWMIRRVNEWQDTVFIDLVLNGVTIYGVKVAKTKDGKEFLSMPSRKGSDGKYYNHVYAALSDQQTDEIIQAAYDRLDSEE